MTEAPPQLNLWRVRDFLITWGAQVVSRVGTQVSQFVLPLLVLHATGSATTAGVMAALERVPYVLLALPVGALVERWDKKVVMVAGNFLRAALFGLLAGYLLHGGDDIRWIAAIVLCSGVVYVFYDAANGTVIPQILPARELPRASGWVEGTTALSEVAGPALGGVLIGLGTSTVTGAGYAFGVDAVTYVACGVAVLFLRTPLQPAHGERPSLRSSIVTGVRYVWRHRELRRLTATSFANVAAYGTIPLSFMTLASTGFHLGSAHIGYLISLGALSGVGGSFCTGLLNRRLGPYGVMALAGSCWATGQLLLALSPTVWVAAAALVMMLWIAPAYFATVYARRMTIISRDVLTRVNSIYRLVAQTALPAGLAAGGVLIDVLGPRGFLSVAAAIFLTVAVITHRLGGP